jgi:hypothetical protein
MKFFQYIIVASLICIFFLQSGCNNKDKWKAVPLKITKQESFNYSEMISGELDSTAKAELEAVKRITTENINNDPDEINKSSTKNKKGNSIWQGIKNTCNWFLDLF